MLTQNIEVKKNNVETRQVCPVCNEEHSDSEIPLWFFSDDKPLCKVCAQKKTEPELYYYTIGYNRGWDEQLKNVMGEVRSDE